MDTSDGAAAVSPGTAAASTSAHGQRTDWFWRSVTLSSEIGGKVHVQLEAFLGCGRCGCGDRGRDRLPLRRGAGFSENNVRATRPATRDVRYDARARASDAQPPPPVGAPDAKVRLQAFVASGNPCHGATIATLRAAAEALPNHIRLEFVDTNTDEGRQAAAAAGIHCLSGLLINSKLNLEYQGENGEMQKVEFSRPLSMFSADVFPWSWLTNSAPSMQTRSARATLTP